MNSILKIIIGISFFILLVHYNNSYFIFQYNAFHLKVDTVLFVFTLIVLLYLIVKASNRIFLIRNIDNAKLAALVSEIISADYSSELNVKKIKKIFEKNKKILSFYGYYQNLKDLLELKLILSENDNQALSHFCNEITANNKKKHDILMPKILFEYIKDNKNTVSVEHYRSLFCFLKEINAYKKDKYEANILFLFSILHKDVDYGKFLFKIYESVRYITRSGIFYTEEEFQIFNYKTINQKHIVFSAFHSMVTLVAEDGCLYRKGDNKAVVDIKFAFRLIKDMMTIMKKSSFNNGQRDEILNTVASTVLISEKLFLKSNKQEKYFGLLKDYIATCSNFFNYDIVFQYIKYCSILNIDNSEDNYSFRFLTKVFPKDYKYKILICYLILGYEIGGNYFNERDLWEELLHKNSIDNDDIKFLLHILHKQII